MPSPDSSPPHSDSGSDRGSARAGDDAGCTEGDRTPVRCAAVPVCRRCAVVDRCCAATDRRRGRVRAGEGVTSDLGGGESEVAPADQRSECAHGRGAVAVGIGARPGTESARIVRAVEAVVGAAPVACLATLDRRATEPGVRAAAVTLGVPLVGFTAEQLSGVDVQYDSGRAAAAVGTPSVAEAAALLVGDGEIVFGRTIVDGIVVAAATMSPRMDGDRPAPN